MAKKDQAKSPPRSGPEDLGFAVYKLSESTFRIPEGSDLGTELKNVRCGSSIRREGPRPDGKTVLRELLTADGVELDVKVVEGEVPLPSPIAKLHFADATGGKDGLRMVMACFDEKVTPALLWELLHRDILEPGDTLWVYADAVTEKDAELMSRIVRLRLC